ncbi:MAG: PQQ-binding-like beta-propeller repeat protein [Planctomycetes bacterium]|nr:PQQ-binding-like beta-propeller repeat protein [Planctomycetota bacterium]
MSFRALKIYEERQIPVPLSFYPVLWKDSVIVSEKNAVRCFNIHDGTVIWKYERESASGRKTFNLFNRSFSAAVNSQSVFAIVNKAIVRLNLQTGKPEWVIDLNKMEFEVEPGERKTPLHQMKIAKQFSAPVVHGKRLFFNYVSFTTGDSQVFCACLDAATGKVVWNTFEKPLDLNKRLGRSTNPWVPDLPLEGWKILVTWGPTYGPLDELNSDGSLLSVRNSTTGGSFELGYIRSTDILFSPGPDRRYSVWDRSRPARIFLY